MITQYAFRSSNNAGTVLIDPSKFTSSNMTYSMDTLVNFQYYIGGSLFDAFDMRWQFDAPASSGISNYKAVGTDSLYFSSGLMTLDPSAGLGPDPVVTQPCGAKISWSGDTLVLRVAVIETKDQLVNGANAKVTNDVLQIIKLTK